jgi:hypothetical protein
VINQGAIDLAGREVESGQIADRAGVDHPFDGNQDRPEAEPGNGR